MLWREKEPRSGRGVSPFTFPATYLHTGELERRHHSSLPGVGDSTGSWPGPCDWGQRWFWGAESWFWSGAVNGNGGREGGGRSPGARWCCTRQVRYRDRGGLSPPLCPRTAMAPKRKLPAQREGPEQKRQQQGAEEDSFHSTAEALRAAPTETRVIRVDPACPLSRSSGTQVTFSPEPGLVAAHSEVQIHSDHAPGLSSGHVTQGSQCWVLSRPHRLGYFPSDLGRLCLLLGPQGRPLSFSGLPLPHLRQGSDPLSLPRAQLCPLKPAPQGRATSP